MGAAQSQPVVVPRWGQSWGNYSFWSSVLVGTATAAVLLGVYLDRIKEVRGTTQVIGSSQCIRALIP